RIKGTEGNKLRQPRRVPKWCASRVKGRKKTLCPQRYRGSVKAQNMTMRVRKTLKGNLRMKVKKTRKPNCFFCSCAYKKLNQNLKVYQNMRLNQRRKQNQKRK
uniref:Uncharacterized protein n=1 Tax=Bos indicus x Bos taurus TaxID=30522 RepID=A0A4W2DQC5_BOBOX